MSQTPKSSNRQPSWRAERRRALRERGPVPKQERVFIVDTSTMSSLPEWIEKRRVKGFGLMNGQVWLRAGRTNRLAAASLRFIEVDFKRCVLCNCPLIGAQAEAYRKQMETDRSLPCSPSCARARELRVYAA